MKNRFLLVCWYLAFSTLLSCTQDKIEIQVFPYDSHIELQWPKINGARSYLIFASLEGGEFVQRIETSDTLVMDFWKNKVDGRKLITYKVEALTDQGAEEIGKINTRTREMNEEELLDMVQYYTFRYFYHGAEPNSAMAPERIHLDGDYPANDPHIVTTGGTGFGIFGLISGIERGWISKEQGLAHFNKMVSFLEKSDRYNGIWAHWLDGQTGKTKAFSKKDDGADLVESAFLMQGLIAVREYYKNGTAEEKQLSTRINRLWEEMQWNFHAKENEKTLYWHWSPNFGWEMNFPLEGYNECLITYVLAAASPTYSITPDAYKVGWARSGGIKKPVEAFGFPLQLKHNTAETMGGPLFWAHYSFIGLDPRGLNDDYAEYWKENQNQTLINRAWCIENPGNYKGYGEDLWGLTASYSINGYNAHHPGNDTGVISPTAALSSIPYTYEESMKVLKNLYFNYGDKVFGKYGFYDAMSPEHDFFPQRYLAIDQGPIVGMIENYRTGLGWKLFMQAPEISSGLEKLGFTVNKNSWEEQ